MTTDNDDTPDADTTDHDRCSNCGAHIDTERWHPVTSQREDDSVVVYTFCSESCQSAWDG